MLSTQSLVPVLVLLLALSGNGFLFADAIIGGHLVEKQQLNYMAAVLVNGNQECGGVLVSPIMVLTAAECIMGRKVTELKVTVGTNDLSDGTGQTIDVMEAIIHISAYYPKNDTALLKLTKMIAFNGYVGVIEIANRDQTYPENTTAITSGFGVVNVYDQKESLLRYANIEIWGDRYCKPYHHVKEISVPLWLLIASLLE
ncbi:uncharacterized protein Dwil_GK28179 [Drosophila willistoni]|uniref:Peptidase S1 domain-containing protein n=1 Tax=Drosophila willistoni TaxID=7260 RepID=A0A0Q9WZ81_DROWI|nr:uncharacterized protein Dwil_GK28179 [Drosophila willistoni]